MPIFGCEIKPDFVCPIEVNFGIERLTFSDIFKLTSTKSFPKLVLKYVTKTFTYGETQWLLVLRVKVQKRLMFGTEH
jgi:hypothetical protein